MASLKISVIMALIIVSSLLEPSAGLKNVCQSGCDTDVRECYTSAGHMFGTVKTDANTPRSILTCNDQYSKCARQCASVRNMNDL